MYHTHFHRIKLLCNSAECTPDLGFVSIYICLSENHISVIVVYSTTNYGS